jgi:translocation-and-assembly-module (TAM) inner membrane subunit TamB-like protein
MTEPREPETEDPGPDQPHGLAEEIRHEIEEVVEHVPRPLRWTVGKLVRLAILSVVGIVVVLVVTAVLYVANRTEWAAQELALLINQTLASRTDVVLEIADIKGNPFTGVRVLRPRVRFRSGNEPNLLEAPEMRLRYSAWALATRRERSVVLEIDRPIIRLARGPDGKLRLPIWKPGPPRGRARELDVILRLRNGAVITPDTVGRIDGLDLEALAHVGHPTRVDVRSLRWAHGPFGSVLDRGAFTYAGGDSAHLDVKEVRTRDLALRGRAAWASGGPEAIVHLEVARVRWRWLSRVLHRDDFDVPGEGHAVVDARAGQALTGRFSAGGIWDSLTADVRGGFRWRDHQLRVEPLVAQSRAGDLDGVVLWAQSGWEIAARVRGGDPSRWSMIGIRHWPAGNLNGRFRYAVDTRAVKHARLSAWLGASEWTGWRADSGIVRVDFTPVGPDSFMVLAERRGGEMRLRALTDDTGWGGEYVLTRYPLDEWAEGRASGIRGTLGSGRGTAESHSGNLRVTGSLDGVVTDWLGIHTARWRMSGMSGALLPAPDLTADVRLEDFTFLTVHWDSLSVRLHVGDGMVALPGLAAFAGDTVLAMTARADWDPGGWRLTADSAEVRSDQFHWTAEPPMRFAGDSHGVDFDRLVAHDGDAQLSIEGRWAGPGGAYDWSARAEHLDLGRLGLPREWELGGRADGQLRITGVSGDPQWELRARSWMPGSRGHRADSIQVVIGGGPSRLVVREALTRLGDGTLSAAGEVTGMARAWPDTLTGPGVLHWVSDASRWTGLVRADGLVIDRLQKLVPAARGWTGRASGTLELGGRPGSPDLTWNAEAQPLAWGDYRLDRAVAHGRYRDGRLEVPELRLIRRGVVSTVTGSMPLRIAVGRRPQVDEAPMEWRVDLPDGDLALLPYFVPQIGSAAGKFELSARLTGTVSHPDLSGTARVRDGHGVRLAGREEVLDGVNAVFTLDESRITLDTLTARQRKRQGSPGYVSAQGVVNLRALALKDYRFKLDLRDFTAVEAGVYAALVDGRFVVTNGPRRGGVTLPLVEGNVELRRGVVLFDFANQSQLEMVAAATKPLYWVYRVQLSANDNLRWKPPQADIEFSADLRLEQTPDSLIIYGDMAGLRGSYYYLSNKFTMDRVNLTFDNVGGGVNPKLDILATTRVSKSAGTSRLFGAALSSPAERGNENITVAITGRAAEPVMAFSSEGGWDQPTILAALTYGQVGDRKLAAGVDFADAWVTRNLNRQLSDELSNVFQGYLNDWTLERESGGLFQGVGDYVIGTNVPLSRDINVRVRQRLGLREPGTTSTTTTTNPFERDVEAEYRISRFFFITSQLTQRRPLSTTSGTATTPPEFNVNLKARWEY